MKYVANTEYTENLTESEKRKLRKQTKHYVSKENLLYYVSAKGETRRVVRETEKHRILYFSVQMKLNDVEGTYHCPLCNKPSVQDVVGCDNCMEWCLTKEPKSKTWFCGYCDLKPYKNIVEFVIKVISSCTLIYVSMEQIA